MAPGTLKLQQGMLSGGRGRATHICYAEGKVGGGSVEIRVYL